MQTNHFVKAGILAAVLVISFVGYLEYFWRNKGFKISYNDDKVLWASQRKKVDAAPPGTTVFIGGSRIKFDLDIPTWEKLTGGKVIQLALVGTPSRLILRDLGGDEHFKGKLIIDVMEFQYFAIDSARRDKFAREGLEYYYKETPAQKASAFINYQLESKLVFLEEGKFGLTSLLNTWQLHNRTGVVPPNNFPIEFSSTTAQRQTFMTPMFLADPGLQQKQIDAWIIGGINAMKKAPGIKGDTLINFLAGIKTSIDRIRARGGEVIFVRPPSSNKYWETEQKIYPRRDYWDRLLEYTNTQGIHFSDYPEIAHFACPEWSHLSPADAIVYTNNLVKILKEEKGWVFQHD